MKRSTDLSNRELAIRNARLNRVTSPLPGSIAYDNDRPLNIPGRFDRQTLIDCVCGMFPHVERCQWEAWFRQGHILRDGQPTRPDRVVRGGEQYWHRFPNTVEPPVNAGSKILWEDDSLISVNKSAPLPVHPCGRFQRNTLTSFLDSVYRPGELRVVHRLDANTTGVLLLARSGRSASQLRAQFQNGTVKKRYLVRCSGNPTEDRFECSKSIGKHHEQAGRRKIDPAGLEAKTEFHRIATRDDGTSMLEAIPRTGRTNQIRLHLWSMGMPVVGDPTYLPQHQLAASQTLDVNQPPMCLHASELTLVHPQTGELQTWTSPAPSWFRQDSLGTESSLD